MILDPNIISVAGVAMHDFISSLPEPVRQNAFKAFARLCTAAVEYPAVFIEGAVAEKRAETAARVKLIETSGNQIAEQMKTNPEFVRAAGRKFAQKVVRERVNIDQIAEIAGTELTSEPSKAQGDTPTEGTPISEDWLNVFENEAANISSEQMQQLFGKILAGEIRKPSSYSIKTIKLVAQLDNRAATLFRLLCSLAISYRESGSNIIQDARVVSMGESASTNSLRPYGLDFDSLNILQEYGLIISDYNSWFEFQAYVDDGDQATLPLDYLREQWALVVKVDPGVKRVFKFNGVALSRCGRELLPVVDIRSNEEYTTALSGFFAKQGMTLVKVYSC
jgi:hypothetical protein